MRIDTHYRYKIIVNGRNYQYTNDQLSAVRRAEIQTDKGYSVTVVDQEYAVGDARRYPYKARLTHPL